MWYGIGALGVVLYLVLLFVLGLTTLRKGHWVMFILGIFLPERRENGHSAVVVGDPSPTGVNVGFFVDVVEAGKGGRHRHRPGVRLAIEGLLRREAGLGHRPVEGAAGEPEERDEWRREHLRKLIAVLKNGLRSGPWRLLPSDTAIQPLVVGANAEALALSARLAEKGLLVPAIRPPTVPRGTARLRISLSADHRIDDVERLVTALRSNG